MGFSFEGCPRYLEEWINKWVHGETESFPDPVKFARHFEKSGFLLYFDYLKQRWIVKRMRERFLMSREENARQDKLFDAFRYTVYTDLLPWFIQRIYHGRDVFGYPIQWLDDRPRPPPSLRRSKRPRT